MKPVCVPCERFMRCVGLQPLSEHYLPDFRDKCEHYTAFNRGKPLTLIKDC